MRAGSCLMLATADSVVRRRWQLCRCAQVFEYEVVGAVGHGPMVCAGVVAGADGTRTRGTLNGINNLLNRKGGKSPTDP